VNGDRRRRESKKREAGCEGEKKSLLWGMRPDETAHLLRESEGGRGSGLGRGQEAALIKKRNYGFELGRDKRKGEGERGSTKVGGTQRCGERETRGERGDTRTGAKKRERPILGIEKEKRENPHTAGTAEKKPERRREERKTT